MARTEADGCVGGVWDTPRLILRPLTAGDAELIAPLIADPEVATRTASIPYPNSLADAQSWVARVMSRDKEEAAARVAILRRSDGAFMGVVGLLYDAERAAELGYWMGRAFWGQGYATEAVARLLRFGFEEAALERVEAGAFADNAASIRVLEKAGYVREGHLRQSAIKDGVIADQYLYARYR